MSETEILPTAGLIGPAPAFEADYTPAALAGNFDQLREWASALVEGYGAGWLDPRKEADLRQARRDRAYFAGLARGIDQRRKAVKAAYSAPLKAFEGECRSVTAILQGAADQAGAVVAEGDRLYREAKEQALRDHWEAFAGELVGVTDYGQYADPAWLNRTCSLAKAIDELTVKVERTARDWEALRAGEGSDRYDVAEREFFRTLDLAAALKAQSAAVADDARIAALKAAIGPAPQAPEAPQGETQPRPRWVLEIDGATPDEVRKVGDFVTSIGLHGTVRRV